MLVHTLHPRLARNLMGSRPLRVLVVGAGGNGSKLLIGLKHLYTALVALGYPGLHVTLADGDTVSESNLVRQSFYPSDVGLNKATVLINRINLATGTSWEAHPKMVSAGDIENARVELLISCVDTRRARAEIQEGSMRGYHPPSYTLDVGNGIETGQFVLGCPHNYANPRQRDRLRTAAELFPELIDTTLPEDDAPSCSTIEALEQQDLFINDLLVTHALNLLWRLLRHHQITHHGAFVNARSGSVSPIPIDPSVWRRLKRQGRRALSTVPKTGGSSQATRPWRRDSPGSQ